MLLADSLQGDVAQQVKAAEKAATSIQKKPNPSAMPIRQYLVSHQEQLSETSSAIQADAAATALHDISIM
jgi:ABC-type cobalamin transport system ATPase subunit